MTKKDFIQMREDINMCMKAHLELSASLDKCFKHMEALTKTSEDNLKVFKEFVEAANVKDEK